MPTNFPASNDVFNIPAAPASTPLGSAGSSDRTHGQNHRDLGDALVAMQGEATLKAHTHDGVTFRHGQKLAQANTHQSPDTDASTTSLHHTVGTGANQYATGTHTHPAVATYPIGAFFMAWVATYPGVTDPGNGTPGLGLVGVWTAVGQRFLCASGGGLGFAAGTTGGSNSHSHTMDATTNTQAAHGHTLSQVLTGAGGAHAHSTNGLQGASRNHFHASTTFTQSHTCGGDGVGTNNGEMTGHAHNVSNASPSHSHSTPDSGGVGDHAHNLPSTSLGSSTTHNHNNSTPATANNLLPLFVVYMWKRTS